MQHEDMVARITDTWSRATPEQRLAGARWYPNAGAMVKAIASATDAKPFDVARVVAALSPRNPWLWNIADAYAFCVAARSGQPRPSATTFGRNQATAWAILTAPDSAEASWSTSAPKVRSFVRAILGDRFAVVVDTWAYRVATGHDAPNGWGSRQSVYDSIELAYTEAAQALGHDPRDVQAVTWLVAQAEGLTSNRRGRPDLAHKRGTPDFVRSLVVAVAL